MVRGVKGLLILWKTWRISRLERILGKRRSSEILRLEAQIEELTRDLIDEQSRSRHLEMTLQHQALVIEVDRTLIKQRVLDDESTAIKRDGIS